MKRIRNLAGIVVMAAASATALAQYPKKPISIIVPFAAGGPTDAIARTLGRGLQQSMGQAVVVENKPGAEGQIALQYLHKAAADGYTLYIGPDPAGLAGTREGLPFDPLTLTPVANLARATFGLYVSSKVPARSVEELVRYAKAHPDLLNYASSTQTEDMASVHFLKASGTRMVRVPFKGSAQAIPELLAGRVQVYFGPLSPERLAYAKDGRLSILATLSEHRTPFTPEVPTLEEAGYPAPMVSGWNMLVGPPGLPQEIVKPLAEEVSKALARPDVREYFEQTYLTVGRPSPDDAHATVQADYRMWRSFMKEFQVN